MSQKSEKYARALLHRQEVVESRMTQTEDAMARWEHIMQDIHVRAIEDARHEKITARRRAREAETAVRIWKTTAYASLATASIVLALAIASTAAKAEEAPPAPVPEAPMAATIASVMELPEAPEQPRFSRIIENATITHYCVCEQCCGKSPDHPAYGITASGREAVPYYSVAVDPCLIELGSTLYLDFGDGELVECRADDTGAAVNGAHIDYCVSDHQEALSLGVRTAAVYIEELD